jgi:hypothetical protein
MTRWKAHSPVLERLFRLIDASVRTKPGRHAKGAAPVIASENSDTPAPLNEAHLDVIDSFRQGDIVDIDLSPESMPTLSMKAGSTCTATGCGSPEVEIPARRPSLWAHDRRFGTFSPG